MLTLYLCIGRSAFFGGSQCIIMLILSFSITVSPSVRFNGGLGLDGSEIDKKYRMIYKMKVLKHFPFPNLTDNMPECKFKSSVSNFESFV